MSENLVLTKNLTNLKPDSWYEEYLKIEYDYILKHPEAQSKIPLITITQIKTLDILADKNQSHDNVSGFLQFEEKNNLEMNKKLLEEYKSDLESLEKWNFINDINEIEDESEEYCMLNTYFKINKIYPVKINEGVSIK